MTPRILSSSALLCLTALFALAADTIPPIPRVLPPEGLEIPADVRTRLETRLEATKKRLQTIYAAGGSGGSRGSFRAGETLSFSARMFFFKEVAPIDAEIFTKAVELALLHREFYVEKDFAKADWALDEANKRLDLIEKSQAPWREATGTLVAGYRSKIDGSAQPYGLVIPERHLFAAPCPLYVWLHGRGDKATDLHFLYERATKAGQITPPNAIVVHPFGRHCVGWKHAGEIDVLEVVESVKQRYNIDRDRIVLIGFSMGGAGAWHIGAHYSDRWLAVSPGAGFVDVARYQKLTPDRAGEWYVQKLWGLYDVPDCVRNFFNTNVIAYSGELDKQREAAVIMEEAFKGEGRTLTHLIGPGVEHKYEPETLKELLKRLNTIVVETKSRSPESPHAKSFGPDGKNYNPETVKANQLRLNAIAAKTETAPPESVSVQTRTLRYPGNKWVSAERLTEHWIDSRIDADFSPGKINVATKNIAQFKITVPGNSKDTQFLIDGQPLQLGQEPTKLVDLTDSRERWMATFAKRDGMWQSAGESLFSGLVKKPGLQGPIDDAFLKNFVVIRPTGKSKNPRFQQWVDFELQHFADRWRALMRAEPPIANDTDYGDNGGGLWRRNVVLWGDPDSNRVMAWKLQQMPVTFADGQWTFGDAKFDGDRFVPAFIYPEPPRSAGGSWAGSSAYVVLNSGLTFREAHDGTNSQQNPKLPDWAIIDITQPPNASTPGRIHDADFFDENWQLKRQPKAP